MYHPKGILAAIQLGAAPFHTAIGRTFKEMEAIRLRETLQVIQCENELTIDKTINHQTIINWVDLWHTAMVTLKTKAVWRYKPF